MDTFQFDLLENPAVQQLKDDSQYKALFHLLELLLAGNMKVSSYRRLDFCNQPHICISQGDISILHLDCECFDPLSLQSLAATRS